MVEQERLARLDRQVALLEEAIGKAFAELKLLSDRLNALEEKGRRDR